MHTYAATAPQVSATSAVITAVIAVITGTIAIATFLTLRRNDQKRTRPVVVAELSPRPITLGATELGVTNVGPTIARNIQVTFNPAIPDVPDQPGSGNFAKYIRNRYNRVIPTLAPGQRLNNIYSNLSGNAQRGETDEPVPRQLTVTINYQDSDRNDYTDTYDLDLDVIAQETMAYPGDTQPDKVQRRIARALEIIANGTGRI